MRITDYFKSLFKTISPIKSKVFHWLSEPRWANRLALYFLVFVLVYIIFKSTFSYSGFLHTDVDSARYMLSALVQSEAAIVALVVDVEFSGCAACGAVVFGEGD
jgi:hypothetical protein